MICNFLYKEHGTFKQIQITKRKCKLFYICKVQQKLLFKLIILDFFIIKNRMEKDKQNNRSYKDLIKENMRLNSQLRKIGSQLNRNPVHSLSKIQNKPQIKNRELTKQLSDLLERKKNEQMKNYKVLLSRKKLDSLNKVSTQQSLKSEYQTSNQQSNQKSIKKRYSLKNNVSSLQLQIKNAQRKNRNENINNQRGLSLIKNSSLQLDKEVLMKHLQREKYQIQQKKVDSKIKYSLSISELMPSNKNQKQLLKWIRENIIGFNTSYISQIQLPIETVYVDHTATNRPFKSVEVLVDHAKLFAANPHTQFSRFGKFSTELMHYARDSLLRSFSASKDEYVVLPTGGGSTGAIQKTLHIIRCVSQNNQCINPTVFLTPYEHHSNILPWVQFYQKIEVLAHDKAGTLLIQQIYNQLLNCSSEHLIITISAASNVSSKITNLSQFNQLIKRVRQTGKKKLIFAVDCAAFCCHHQLNLSIYDEIDFAFLSPHKNLGGSQSCGVLLARRNVLKCKKPTFPGGGTVKFVKGYSKKDVMYEVEQFARQIAGTPPFLGFYRAALSFELLKNVIGYDFIHKKQRQNTQLFFKMIDQINKQLKQDNIDMLVNVYGQRDLNERANVVTFNFEYGKQYLQHSLASLILTDIFGIQIRSGCFCAGPYGMMLLSIHKDTVANIQDEIKAGIMINKPGYLRLDLTFYLQTFEVEYIAKAISLIGRYWKNMLKIYTICNGGQVVLLPIFSKNQTPQIYSLSQIQQAHKKLKEQHQTQHIKLQKRKETLQKQLKIGQFIFKNPIQFLKKFKQDNFSLDSLLQN